MRFAYFIYLAKNILLPTLGAVKMGPESVASLLADAKQLNYGISLAPMLLNKTYQVCKFIMFKLI